MAARLAGTVAAPYCYEARRHPDAPPILFAADPENRLFRDTREVQDYSCEAARLGRRWRAAQVDAGPWTAPAAPAP